MILNQLTINCCIFLIGFFGIALNYRSILVTLMGIEIMLLSANLNFIIFSLYLDDLSGQIISLFILTIAASELAIGLAILIVSYKVMGTIEIDKTIYLKS